MRFAAWLSMCVLLLASPALAADVVLYGPGTPSAEAAARAEAAYKVLTGSEEGPEAGLASVVDLPFPSQDPIWMAGDLLELPCADKTLSTVDPSAALKETIAHVDELDYEKALLKVDQGIRSLPCTSHDVTRKTLVDLHFFQGITEFMMGNKSKAKRGFSAALALDIETRWKKNYPPAPQAVFLDAKSDLLSRGTAPLGIDVSGGEIEALSVDGLDVDVGAPGELLLYRGRHLVRYVDQDDKVRAALVDVSGEGGALVTRPALRTSVLNLAWGGVAESAGRLTLSELARNRGVDKAWVIVGDSANKLRAFSYEVGSEQLTPLSVDGAAVAALLDGDKGGKGGKGGKGAGGAASDGDAGRVGLVVTGGAALTGKDLYGVGALRVHFRLVAGLELGLGFQAGFGDYDATRYLFQPLINVDVRYRFEGGPFHLYFGGRGLVGFSHSQTIESDDSMHVFGGGAGVIGFDVTPAGDKGFVINLDLGLGGLSRADGPGGQLYVGLGAGVGFRI